MYGFFACIKLVMWKLFEQGLIVGHKATCRVGRVKRIWYLSPVRAAKVQASLRINAVSPEPPLLAHTSSESRGTFRQKARSLAPLNGWAYAVKICHDGMLEDTNSLDAARGVKCLQKDSANVNAMKQTCDCYSCMILLSCVMRKPFYAICEQQRCRSACASTQSDQHFCCSLPR